MQPVSQLRNSDTRQNGELVILSCDRNYEDYQVHGEPVYNRGDRHGGDYHKETYYRASYHQGRGESSRYRNNVPEAPHKYSYKHFKAPKKESEIRLKTSPAKPAPKVTHNPSRTIVTIIPGISEDESETTFLKAKSPQQDAKTSEDCETSLQETAMLESVKEDVKDILQPEKTMKEEQLLMSTDSGKIALSEEKDLGVCVEQREGEPFVEEGLCSNQDRDDNLEQTDQIPFLGCWGDMPSEFVVSASTSEQVNTGSDVNSKLPETTHELRTAFILARKEQLEVAFAQDCKTFAIVASTLLKKDPSIEAALTSALRSNLQEMAGFCVQELNNFIDHYDSHV